MIARAMHGGLAAPAAIHRPLIELPDISDMRRRKRTQRGPSDPMFGRDASRTHDIGVQTAQDIS
jgi:hypothetical protein